MLGMASSHQYWEKGREQILAQSPKKGTGCHYCDARLPEDYEQVGVGCLKSPRSADCHNSSLKRTYTRPRCLASHRGLTDPPVAGDSLKGMPCMEPPG